MTTARPKPTTQQEVELRWSRALSSYKLYTVLNHAANADAGAQPNNVTKAPARFVVTKVRYVNPTGLAAHATNYVVLTVKQGSVVIATWSTLTGQQGTLSANTYVDMVLSSTAADLIVEADETVTANVDESGTTTVPAGRFEIYGRWISDDVDFVLHSAPKRTKVDGVQIKLLDGLAASNTNYYLFQLKNGSTVVATYDTRAAHEGALTADTFRAMTLSTTAADLVVEAAETLTLHCDENGDALLSDLELVINARHL